MSSLTKTLAILLGLALSSTSSFAATYYIASNGSDSSAGTSTSAPASMKKLQTIVKNGTIKAGDKVLFKSGDSFTPPDQYGGLQWWSIYGGNASSGASGNPITLSSYGTGAKPNFQFTNPSSVAIDSRSAFSFLAVSYIVIDGLTFIDTRFPASDKVNPAYTSAGINMGEIGNPVDHITVKNCEFSNIGNGINIVGNYNTVTQSKFTDLKAIINTASPDYEDYGANGITNTGSNNTYTYNYMNGLWAASLDFGWNGGAFEMYEGGHNNVMMYNTIIDTGGFAEYGSSSSGNTAGDDIIAYNLVINVGDMLWINGVGYSGFAEDVRNLQFFNNTVIENSQSRFSGANAGEGLPASYQTKVGTGESRLFGYGGTAPATWAVLKNNIFVLNTGLKVAANGNNIIHENNLYSTSGNSTVGYPLTTTSGKVEISTSSAIFTNTSSGNPELWNYNLPSSSPAVDIGASVGISADLNGTSVPQGGKPDAGAFEYTSAPVADTTSPNITITSPVFGDQMSGKITITATASDNSGKIDHVEFYDGSDLLATVTTSPYKIEWNSANAQEGGHTIFAVAYDKAGNIGRTTLPISISNNGGVLIGTDSGVGTSDPANSTNGGTVSSSGCQSNGSSSMLLFMLPMMFLIISRQKNTNENSAS